MRKKNKSVEDSESAFENEEVLMTEDRSEDKDSVSEEEMKRDEKRDEERDEERDAESEDDSEEYRNKICGEKDPLIVPGSRINVYWKGSDEWFLGRVVRWNEIARQYEVEYDDEDEAYFEHLTGPSRRKFGSLLRRQEAPKSRSVFNFYSLFYFSRLFSLISSLLNLVSNYFRMLALQRNVFNALRLISLDSLINTTLLSFLAQ
jgi:hypothetical protein